MLPIEENPEEAAVESSCADNGGVDQNHGQHLINNTMGPRCGPTPDGDNSTRVKYVCKINPPTRKKN